MSRPTREAIERSRRITRGLARTAAVLLVIAAVLMAIAREYRRAAYLVVLGVVVFLALGRR